MARSMSIIIELENLLKSDPRRAERLFERLVAQMRPLDVAFEVLVLHDPDDVTADAVEALLLRSGVAPAEVTIVPAPGKRYYELKNLGAERARGELVLFVDSDLIPEEGFLRSMIGAFDDPEVEVVAASPYVDPCRTLFEKSFALFWLFPLRSQGGPLEPIREYAANSVAFRRELFLRQPFPDSPCYRRQCALQAKALMAEGHQLWGNPEARVQHPPPRTWRDAIARALREGRDRYFDRRMSGTAPAKNPVTAARGMQRSMSALGERMRRHAARVGLSQREMPAALAIAATYELAVRAGFVATWISPRLTPDK